MAIGLIHTISNNPVLSESELEARILDILAGNGKKENMRKDAAHLFEACKYGSYFITTDKRILKNRDKLYDLGINCKVMLPSEFYKVVEHFKKQNELEKQILLLHTARDKYKENSSEYKALDRKAIKLEKIWGKNNGM